MVLYPVCCFRKVSIYTVNIYIYIWFQHVLFFFCTFLLFLHDAYLSIDCRQLGQSRVYSIVMQDVSLRAMLGYIIKLLTSRRWLKHNQVPFKRHHQREHQEQQCALETPRCNATSKTRSAVEQDEQDGGMSMETFHHRKRGVP